MANTKISDFTSGAPAQSTDAFVIARTGANFKLAASDIKTLVVGAGSVSVASGKTLTANNTLTLAGTDGTTMTFPSTSATIARTDAGNTFTGNQVVSSGSFGLSGNISAAAWTTNGIRYANSAATLTDTTSSGTVAAAYTDLFGGNTIAASNATTFTDYYTTWFNAPTAGTNVTFTRNWALGLGGSLQIASASELFFGTDLRVGRRGTANLRLGAADAAAPVAQTLSVQSVVAGTSNTAGANLTITGSQGTGTGAGGSIVFQVAPAGSTGTAQNALVDAAIISSDGRLTLSRAGAQLRFSLDSTFIAGNDSTIINISNKLYVRQNTNSVFMPSDVSLSWSSSTSPSNVGDTVLVRDTSNTLALRNGANAQTFNVYNTFTSSTNFERYSVDWITTSNLVIVGPNKGSGGGTQRVQRLAYLEDGGTGSTTPSLGTTCPAASATIKSWIKVITSDGSTGYIPCWA